MGKRNDWPVEVLIAVKSAVAAKEYSGLSYRKIAEGILETYSDELAAAGITKISAVDSMVRKPSLYENADKNEDLPSLNVVIEEMALDVHIAATALAARIKEQYPHIDDSIAAITARISGFRAQNDYKGVDINGRATVESVSLPSIGILDEDFDDEDLNSTMGM